MKKWTVDQNNYFLTDVTAQISELPPYVYQLNMTPKGQFYLSHVMDEFEMPKRVYGSDKTFVDRVVKSYEELGANQGVLLSGHKGGGKTLTARMIGNKAKRPVILVTTEFEGDMAGFLGSLKQEVVIFIDEYDKIFEESDRLLSLLDGIYNSPFKKLFLLTKNDGRVSRFMIDRPGRIRYLKEYGNLDVATIREIVEDLLENKEHLDALVQKLGLVEIITVDIVKSIITEMNLHNMSPDEAFLYFNITLKNTFFDLYELSADGKSESLLYTRIKLHGWGMIDSLEQLPRHRNAGMTVVSETEGNTNIGRLVKVSGNVLTVEESGEYDEEEEKVTRVTRTYVLHKHYLFSAASLGY